MKKAVKAKWLKALRSGKYKQGTGRLRVKNKYCCLGVLATEMGAEWQKFPAALYPTDDFQRPYVGGRPVDIKSDAGNYLRPTFCGLSKTAQTLLSDMNDGTYENKLSFKKIADWISKNIEATA